MLVRDDGRRIYTELSPDRFRDFWQRNFFLDAVSMNHREKVQSLQANSGLYAVRS